MAIEIKPPANQREQLLLVGAIVALAAIGGYWYLQYSPKSLELDGVKAHIDTLTVQNEASQREVARGTASTLKAEAAMYGRMLTVMRTLVPSANEVTILIDEISNAARRTGLDIGGLQAPTIINGDVFDTHKYKLNVTGPYHKVSAFLTNIGSLQRIVAPINVSLAPPQGSKKSAVPGEQLLDVAFEIQTYVAKAGKGIQ
jgi:Tfp pilus assembly protein PilO